ncbi:MAG: MoaD/ThiS family protein [Desulfobacteraceae bacterium]
MSINIHIHAVHRHLTGDTKLVQTRGASVGECLAELVKRYPGMNEALFETDGALKNEIEVYRNMESTFPGELAEKVKDGDDIHITLILAGG